MNGEKSAPASFLLVNSKGRPDFIMTMLVVVIVAILLLLLAWLGFNFLALHSTLAQKPGVTNQALVDLVANFNNNTQIIVISLASSVFSLAGAYFLRRASYDKHHLEKKRLDLDRQARDEASDKAGGFVQQGGQTLTHPNYDDEEEDI